MIDMGKPTLFGREVKHPVLVLAAGTAPLVTAIGKLAAVAPAHCVLYWAGRRGFLRDGEIAVDCRGLERRRPHTR